MTLGWDRCTPVCVADESCSSRERHDVPGVEALPADACKIVYSESELQSLKFHEKQTLPGKGCAMGMPDSKLCVPCICSRNGALKHARRAKRVKADVLRDAWFLA